MSRGFSRRGQEYFDGAVIVTEQQQAANVQIRYPESGGSMKRIQRKWEIFPGKNSFYCNGRIVMAQKAGIFYLTIVLIVSTSSLFFAFDCPHLAENVSPAIPAVGAFLFVLVMANLFRTSFSDPGIIPRCALFIVLIFLPVFPTVHTKALSFPPDLHCFS